MTSKQDQILTCVLGMKRDLGEINGHLNALNGSVARNVKDIDTNRDELKYADKRVDRLENKFSYWVGGATAFFIIIQILFRYVF